MTATIGMGHGHAVLQARRQRIALAKAGAARDQRQTLAVVQQLLVAGDAPEREGGGIRRRIGIGRVTRIHVRVFQQTQAPAMRGIGAARTAQPVDPVVGMAAQVLPGQCERVQAQDVEVRGGRIPVRDMVGIDNDASSRRTAGTSSRAFKNGATASTSQHHPNLFKL